MGIIAKKHIVVLVIALAAITTACGSSGSSSGSKGITALKSAEGTGTDATTGPSTTGSPVTQATVAPTTAPPPTAAPAPSGNLAGSWYGPQADNLAPTCQGSTTYTFTSGGQFTASTIYNPNSMGNCVNFSVSGTWSLSGGGLTLSGRPNSPVGQPFTVTAPFSQIDGNTITIDGRMYHRS